MTTGRLAGIVRFGWSIVPASVICLLWQNPVVSAPSDASTIKGIVRLARSHEPLASARVLLRDTADRVAVKGVFTDEQGAFRLEDVPGGRFELSASKPGYLDAQYGAKRPEGLGIPIVIPVRSIAVDVTIDAWRGAVLTGLLRAPGGEAIGNATTTAGRLLSVGGEQVLVTVPAGQAKTDDRGVYRIFGLPPGDYFVWANLNSGVDQVPTYYPGTPRLADSESMRLAAEEIKTGIDFSLVSVPYARITGTVIGHGSNTGEVSVSLINRSPHQAVVTRRTVTTSSGGTFEFGRVPPGEYLLAAQSPARMDSHTPPTPILWASATVQLSGSDLTGLTLALRATENLDGRVLVGGVPPKFPLAFELRLVSRPSGNAISFNDVHADSLGIFQVPGVPPGKYRMTALHPAREGLLLDWILEGIDVDGQDATDVSVEITSSASAHIIKIDFEPIASEISGTFTDGTGMPATDYYLILFPVDRSLWTSERRIRMVRPATDGSFKVSGLPAGQYFVGALTDAGPRDANDPSVLDMVSRTALTRFSLRPGEVRNQSFTLGGKRVAPGDRR